MDMDIITIVFSFVLFLNIFLAAVIIFLEKRNVAATWAWVLVLLFLPVIGFVLYLVIGQNLSRRKIFHITDADRKMVQTRVEEQKNLLDRKAFPYKQSCMSAYDDLIYMNLINAHALLTQDNQVHIYTSGNAKFEALLQCIAEAKDHIHVQYFIIKNDGIGRKIIQALAEKAKQGVEVRVLYDDTGSYRLSSKFFRPLIEAGGEVAAFFPSKIPVLNFRINYRNHRKMVIIDGRYGFVGGFNIGDEYLGLDKRFGFWRDTHLKLQGSAVDHLQFRFYLDWNSAAENRLTHDRRYFPPKNAFGETAVQIVSSGPESDWEQIKNGFIRMIYSAKETIYIQTPYFVPDESVIHALKIAALSGIDVRIMIPNRPDHMFVYWASYSYIGDLLDAGVRSYIYDAGFLHAKTIVVDGLIASVGTANFDMRSFKLSFEVNAFIYDRTVAKELHHIFETDLLRSRELTPDMYARRSTVIKFKESISRLLSPIL